MCLSWLEVKQVFNYINNDDVNVADLKSFVASGKGFMGICAGAYSAAEYTDNWYYGWGLALNVVNLPYVDVGNVTIQTTSSGTEIMGGTDRWISPINGPAMYSTDYSTVTFPPMLIVFPVIKATQP